MRILPALPLGFSIIACALAADPLRPAFAEDPVAAVAGADSERLPWRRLSGPSSIAPPGWERVDGNWQRIDGRPLPDPDPDRAINELIRSQRAVETATAPMRLLATLMVYLRRLDPISLAAAEISIISLLAYRVLRRESARREAA